MPLQLLAGGLSVGSALVGAQARDRETLAAAAREREGAMRRRLEIGRSVLGEYRARRMAASRLTGGD